MSLTPDDLRQTTEAAAAVTGIAAVIALLMAAARRMRDGTVATARWVRNWAAVPRLVAGLAETTEHRFEALEMELATWGAHVSMTMDADGIVQWRCDARGNCTSVSPGYIRLTGVGEPDALGRGWVSLIHPDDVDAGVEQFLDAVGDARPWHAQYRVRTTEGYVLVDSIARPVMARERCVGYVGTSRVITGPT